MYIIIDKIILLSSIILKGPNIIELSLFWRIMEQKIMRVPSIVDFRNKSKAALIQGFPSYGMTGVLN